MHQLGIRTESELNELPATAVDRWRHYFSVEPAGTLADNWRMGVAVASIVNIVKNIPAHAQLKPSHIFPDHRDSIVRGPANPKAALNLLRALKTAL